MIARRALVILLLLLVSLAIPLEASPPLHLHEAGSAGLYNQEHILWSLDSVTGDLPLPNVDSSVCIALVTDACLTPGGGRLFTTVLDLTESRAPPRA
jgi:hypothetical protein